MGSLAKGVAVSLGLLTANVAVNGAKIKAEGNKTVCCGTADTAHDPVPVSQVNRCATCDADVAYTDLRKARVVGDGLVLLTQEELTEANADASAYKKRVSLTPHPVEQVDLLTVQGDKVYYLTPDPGFEAPYAVLRDLIAAHPELAFMGLWTARSRASTFILRVHNDVLMMVERTRADKVKPAPEVTVPEALAAQVTAMGPMAEQVLTMPGIITDFDPETYADTYEAKLADIIASKDVVMTENTSAPAAAPLPAGAKSAMDALAAMLAQAQ